MDDGDTVDITPTVVATLGVDYYSFTADKQVYHPYINLDTDTTNADLDSDIPEVCVGQLVSFEVFDIPGCLGCYAHWMLPGAYVNQQTNYSTNCTSYVRNDNLLTQYLQHCWYVNDPGEQLVSA